MSVRQYIFEGQGRSTEALQIERRGGMPATRAARTIGLKRAKWIAHLFPCLGVFEVGKYGMHVRYYDLSDEGYRAILVRHYDRADVDLAGTAMRVATLLRPFFTGRGAERLRSRLLAVAKAHIPAKAA